MDKKKIISIGIVVLTIVVLIVIAASVGGNNEEPEITTNNTTTEPTTELVYLGYSAEVLEKSLKVYKDDVFVQELVYPEDGKDKFVLGFAENHISFIDMNFDNNEDICLTISTSDDGFNYFCWIFDTEKGEFVFNKTLSSFNSISLDADKKQVISTEKNKKGENVYVLYEWVNGELKKLETKEKLPEKVKDKVLGSTSSNSTTARPNGNNQQNSGTISGTLVPNVTKPSGSSGGNVVLATENKNEVWY